MPLASALSSASLPGASPDIRASCNSKPQMTETPAKIPPGRLHGAQQLCPGSAGRPRPRDGQPLPAGLGGRQGSRPSPSYLEQGCLEPELPAEPRYVVCGWGLPRRAAQEAHGPTHGGFMCEGATRRRHEPRVSSQQASKCARRHALLTQVLGFARASHRGGEMQYQLSQRRNIPGLLLPPCPERDHARSRRRLLGAEEEAAPARARCRLPASRAVWRAHPGSPYSHFVDDPDEDAAVPELRQIIEGISTNFCAVHLEMGRDGQKAEAKITPCRATRRLPVLARGQRDGSGRESKASPSDHPCPAQAKAERNPHGSTARQAGTGLVYRAVVLCEANPQPLYGPAAAHFPSLLPAPGSAPAPGQLLQPDQAVPAFLVTQQER